MKRTGITGINGNNGANGHHPQYGAAASAASPDGDEMDTGKEPGTTEETLTRIIAIRTARIQEDQKDVSAIERVLTILREGLNAARDGDETHGDETAHGDEDPGDEPHGDETAHGDEDPGDEPHGDETAQGDEDPGEETVQGDIPTIAIGQTIEQTGKQTERQADEPSGGPPTVGALLTQAPDGPPGDLLSMTILQVRDLAADPEATAEFFVQARGGIPLDCPKCGSNEHTKRSHGKDGRTDLFRCNTCKTGFGIKTGTAMQASRPDLGAWMLTARIALDQNPQLDKTITETKVANLTGLGIIRSRGMIATILEVKDSPGGPIAGLVRVRTKPDPEGNGPQEAANQETVDPASGQPGSGQPGSGQPGSGQPGSGQPGSGQPGSRQPGNSQTRKQSARKQPARKQSARKRLARKRESRTPERKPRSSQPPQSPQWTSWKCSSSHRTKKPLPTYSWTPGIRTGSTARSAGGETQPGR